MSVVFVVLDSLRKDRLSLYNDEIDFTENLEDFAEDATVFSDAVSQAPWTLPSHASFFTGMYPWEHGATERNLFLDVDEDLLAEKFRDRGYETACFSANPWIAEHTGLNKGFEKINNDFPFISALPESLKSFWKGIGENKKIWVYGFLEKYGEPIMSLTQDKGSSETERIIENTKEFIELSKDDYFVFLNLMDTHLPYFPVEEYRKKHAPEVDPEEVCQVGYKHNAGIVDADYKSLRKLYNAEVDYLDDKLGELLESVDEDTTVVICSDHGEHLGEEGLIDHQFSVSEQLVNVPLLVKSPELNKSRVQSQFELRKLYQLIPSLEGLEERPQIKNEFAYGGLEYPEMHLKNIPEDKKEEFNYRLRFVRTSQEKMVRYENSKFKESKMTKLETGESIQVKEFFLEKLNDIKEADSGCTEVEEKEVKQKLEELGYM